MLQSIGIVTGFDFHVWQEDTVVTITRSSGRVFFESGRHLEYGPKSCTVRARSEARRVRIYITEQSGCLWDDVDETPRGAYPGGLIVLGHVEIPALSGSAPYSEPSLQSDASLGASHRSNLSRLADLSRENIDERHREWGRWKQTADDIRKSRQKETSIREIARLVKDELGLPDSIETIRKKI